MKIAIVGKGTSAILTSLICIKEGHNVEIFYDPLQDHLMVGESTTTHIANVLTTVLDISVGDLVERGVASFKNGTKFIGWGCGKTFRHHFEDNLVGFHFDTNIFNDYIVEILKNVGVIFHAERVDEKQYQSSGVIINNKKYDFVITCSGWSNKNEYNTPIINPVNSVFLYKKETVEDYSYTLHKAHEHGWEFGLPFPDKGLTKYGFLFNDKYISCDKLENKFEGAKHLTWTPRYAKKLIQNNFEAYNGNKLFFVEPLQALSLYHYVIFAKAICKFLDNKNDLSFIEANKYYLDTIHAYQQTLAFHYQFGSIYDTKYWEDMKTVSKKFLETNVNSDEEILFKNLEIYKKTNGEIDNTWIGLYNYPAVKTLYSGMLDKQMPFIL